jgi:hypothetical protein
MEQGWALKRVLSGSSACEQKVNKANVDFSLVLHIADPMHPFVASLRWGPSKRVISYSAERPLPKLTCVNVVS